MSFRSLKTMLDAKLLLQVFKHQRKKKQMFFLKKSWISFLTDFHANPLSLEREAVIHHKDNEKLSNIILIFICGPRAPRHPNLHVNYHHPITG